MHVFSIFTNFASILYLIYISKKNNNNNNVSLPAQTKTQFFHSP